MVLYATFNSISVISRRQVSPVLGWGSEVSYPRTLPRKNPEDPVRLEPRTSGLRVKHFTTESRRTHHKDGNLFFSHLYNRQNLRREEYTRPCTHFCKSIISKQVLPTFTCLTLLTNFRLFQIERVC